jgi:RNA polymerase sigma-70 factor (ECF subfamily)
LEITSAEASDAALLRAARDGDKAALEELLHRHQGQVYRYGMRMCRNPEDAQDILQDTLLAMARGFRDFRGASSLSTWLYTVARSFCIKKRRRSKTGPDTTSFDAAETHPSEALTDPSRPPDEALAGKEVAVALDEAIAALEPSYREVLLLRDVEGLTAPEVAEVLGISVQAVKSRLHRARVAVRDAVAPVLGVPADEATEPRSCPDVLTLFSKHLEDEISADMCKAMQSHLDGCPRCRGTCDSLKHTLALCRTSGAQADVPPEVQLAVKRAMKDFLREAP